MKQVRIWLSEERRALSCAAGSVLLEVLLAGGVPVDAPCGGHGSCGKCLVELREAGGEWRRVQACRTRVKCDAEVRGPEAGELQVLTRGTEAAVARRPWVQCVPVKAEKCALGENTADWERLCRALARETGRDAWQPDVGIAAELGDLLREGGELRAVVAGDRVLQLSRRKPEVCMAAFDLGTTSIAGYLLGADGSVLAQRGMLNPQVSYGADVISRADYALSHGPEALRDCAQGAVDALLGQLCEAAGVAREAVCALSLVGNSCMHHLFLGISPASLARAPYNPAIREPLLLAASDYGIHVRARCQLLVLPVIAGFVGADTVGCMLAGGWERRKERRLMIDIGTNGELVMGNAERMVACSTAAGPAFEGAKIRCGMRGVGGAVDHVWLEGKEVRWHVLGEGEAKGICGSGLLDLIAALLETGELDASGRLACGAEYRLGDSAVVLTQRDVREVQMAKAAIRAGIELLAKQLGIGIGDIEGVEIAGAFGNYMKPESACRIGMIPPELRGRIRGVGNAAGEGAKLVLEDRAKWDVARTLARQAEFLELATLPEFQDVFVDALHFGEEEE